MAKKKFGNKMYLGSRRRHGTGNKPNRIIQVSNIFEVVF